MMNVDLHTKERVEWIGRLSCEVKSLMADVGETSVVFSGRMKDAARNC